MPGYVEELNIKSDLPAAGEALRRVARIIQNGNAGNRGAVKIIHGYGSTGKGGKIRAEVRRYLAGQKLKGLIKDFIPGEEFSIFGKATRDAFELCGELRGDRDLERCNNGITIIVFGRKGPAG